ncbi:MAG: ester cyclase [Dehalococcoidia bacterium]
MSAEGNKKLALDFMDASNRGDLDAAAAMYADECINHGRKVTKEQIRTVLQDLDTTFGDRKTEIHTVVADDDWVVMRTTMRGSHAGKNIIPIWSLTPGTEPTDKPFSVQAIHMFRFADGKITEHWAGRDDLGLHWQLGLIPAPDWAKARMA